MHILQFRVRINDITVIYKAYPSTNIYEDDTQLWARESLKFKICAVILALKKMNTRRQNKRV